MNCCKIKVSSGLTFSVAMTTRRKRRLLENNCEVSNRLDPSRTVFGCEPGIGSFLADKVSMIRWLLAHHLSAALTITNTNYSLFSLQGVN